MLNSLKGKMSVCNRKYFFKSDTVLSINVGGFCTDMHTEISSLCLNACLTCLLHFSDFFC